MLEVAVLCSDQECAEVHEIVVPDLATLDGFTCECGCGLVLLRVSTVELV
jgi:hypothetical protein